MSVDQNSPSSSLAPLRHPVFRAMWLAGSVGFMGLWMQNVAAAWTMTSLTSSPLMVALIQTAATLPAFLLGLPGGVMADQMDRRKLLIATHLWTLTALVALSLLTLSGSIGPWTMLLLTFAVGAGSAVQGPAWQATSSDVLPPPLITAGLSMTAASANMARAVGPALAGLLLVWVGSGTVFAINAFCYFCVIVVLLRWEGPPRRVSELPPERLIAGMRAAVRYMWHSPALSSLYGRCLVIYFSSSAMWALLPVVARDQLQLGASGYGLLMTCLGAGAVIGSLSLMRLQHRFGPNRLMQISNVVSALAMLCMAYVKIQSLVCVALFFAGIGWIGIAAVPNAAIQTGVAAWVRARAIAMFFLTFQIGMASGSVLWGSVASHFGTPVALAAAASMVALILALGRRYPIRFGSDAELAPSLHWLEPVVEVEPDMEDGPVAVQLNFQIDPAQRREFIRAAHALGSIRKRDGATSWRLYRDLEDADRYVERFVVDSWGEYMRQRTRATMSDKEAEEKALAFHIGAEQPRMLHFIGEPAPKG